MSVLRGRPHSKVCPCDPPDEVHHARRYFNRSICYCITGDCRCKFVSSQLCPPSASMAPPLPPTPPFSPPRPRSGIPIEPPLPQRDAVHLHFATDRKRQKCYCDYMFLWRGTNNSKSRKHHGCHLTPNYKIWRYQNLSHTN